MRASKKCGTCLKLPLGSATGTRLHLLQRGREMGPHNVMAILPLSHSCDLGQPGYVLLASGSVSVKQGFT